MDQQSSLQNKTDKPVVAESDGVAPSRVYGFKTSMQESTPHDQRALAGGVKYLPVPKPGGNEGTDRTHDEELPIPSEGWSDLESNVGGRTEEMTHVPIPKPSDDEFTVRAHEPISPEGKLTAQESGEDQCSSPWLKAIPPMKSSYTSSKDLDIDECSYELKVMEDCKVVFQEFPTALGLIVVLACSVAAPSRKLPPVPGVVKGVDKMIQTFSFLGYAVLRLPVDLASWQYRAAMKAVASVSFPELYRHIFVYFTGHGGNDSIDTPDGNLKLVDITTPFSPNEAPHLKRLTKIFIFDTCSLSKHSIFNSILPHSVLLFPAHPEYPAFAETNDCGLLTKYLAPTLRKSLKSFGDILIDVSGAIREAIKNHPHWSKQIEFPSESQPLLCQTLESHVCLLKERKEAMTPSIEIQEVCPTSISVVTSPLPRSLQFHLQYLRLFYKCEGAEQWIAVKANAVPGETVCINDLSHGKHYTVKALAVYPDDEEISSQEMPCEMPAEVAPELHQKHCHVDSVEFEVHQPAKKDIYHMHKVEVVCHCQETQDLKTVEWPGNDRVRISELEPDFQYTVTATAHYPKEQSASVTESFKIPKHDVTPGIDRSEFQKPTCNSITVSVTAPPQADKYHLKNLSAMLWRANEGELQSQTIEVDHDQREETATFRKLSPSTTYVAKAIATYPNKVVSSGPTEITTLSVPYCRILFWVFMVLLFLGSIIALSIFLIIFQRVHVPAVSKLGLGGDTIVASDFNSLGLASVTITECPEEGDDPRTLKATLVKKSDIINYTMNYTNTISDSAAGRVSILEDVYFLQESSIAVNICLSSQYSPLESSRSVPVLAFVFDSSDDNQKFLLNETDGMHSSLYNKVLQVGTTSKPICTWVNYSVASPAYYYLSLGEYALGKLAYSADLYLHVKYLNFSDYEGSEQYCSSVSEMQPCRLELHESLKREEYFLVTYICSRSQWFSPSTHVCARFKNNFYLVVIVPATLGAVTVFLVALIVFVVLYKCVKKRVLLESHEYMLLRSTANDSD